MNIQRRESAGQRARKRQEKARIPQAASGSYKLPQCGRFSELFEYSVLLS
jgi:hypothetical protein